jgi:hypothetical protein
MADGGGEGWHWHLAAAVPSPYPKVKSSSWQLGSWLTIQTHPRSFLLLSTQSANNITLHACLLYWGLDLPALVHCSSTESCPNCALKNWLFYFCCVDISSGRESMSEMLWGKAEGLGAGRWWECRTHWHLRQWNKLLEMSWTVHDDLTPTVPVSLIVWERQQWESLVPQQESHEGWILWLTPIISATWEA